MPLVILNLQTMNKPYGLTVGTNHDSGVTRIKYLGSDSGLQRRGSQECISKLGEIDQGLLKGEPDGPESITQHDHLEYQSRQDEDASLRN